MEKQNELNVIFGTGPLGLSVMHELLKRGKKIRMVNRSGKANVPQGVEIVKGDATNPAQTRELTKGAAVVYQCAQPGYTQWLTHFFPIQNGILEGAAANNAKFIFGDNLYMYGEVTGLIHENLPYTAHTRKGKLRAELAQALMEAHNSGKVRVAIGRGSDFFGEGVLGSMLGDRIFYPAIEGKKAQAIGNVDLPHSYTYIGDFGKGLVMLGENEAALGQTWHIPNAPTVTTREILTIIYEELGQPLKFSTTGKMMMRLGGLFIPEAREVVEMMYEFEKPFVVDHSKFEKAFGNIATPLRESLRNTLAWFKAHPHVKPAKAA
jgi:nucleoside-diphosphate-sugar epimerase